MEKVLTFLDSLQVDAADRELMLRALFQALLLGSSALFSGSETAMFSLSRIDLQKLRNARSPYSESIHAMLDDRSVVKVKIQQV